MLAPISFHLHKNVLDLRRTNNKTPINIIIITERGTADAEEEWANGNTPHPKNEALKIEWKKKVRSIDFVVHEYGT